MGDPKGRIIPGGGGAADILKLRRQRRIGESEGDVFTSLPARGRSLSGAQKALLSEMISAFLKAVELEKSSRSE